VFHRLALPGVPESVVRCTHLSWLRRGCSIYHCRLSRVHDLDSCMVSMTIPFDPVHPWSGSIVGSEPNIGVEMMAHSTLTNLREDRLVATAALPITLLLIQNQENPVWQQHLEAMSDLEGPHFHVGMTSLARYAQYLFNL
jgi:hypothetical protein